MLKKRIIPCLDIDSGRVVKGVNFMGLKDVGDPVSLAKRYVDQGADELVFLDITATVEKRKTLRQLVEKIAEDINIPFTVGGGICSVEDAAMLIGAGADKISVNSAAFNNPDLISSIADRYGSQCVVVAVDVKHTTSGDWNVYTSGGRIDTGVDAISWVKHAVTKGAGEVLLTSMSNDGAKNGFATKLLKKVCSEVSVPVIASGGAGSKQDFVNVFTETNVGAALAASIFHYNEITIADLKEYLRSNNINVR